MYRTPARSLIFCAAVTAAGMTASGCASAPAPEAPARAAAATVTGSPADWQAAVCRDSADAQSGTRHTVGGNSCVPADGDGIVHFDHFESASSMDSVLSWTPSPYVAKTVVDGRPMAIWTPSGEPEDLAPLDQFGFEVVSFRSAALQRQVDDVPATVPSGPVVDLPPNEFGYVVVQTADGETQCIVEAGFVGCQTDGSSWPQHSDGSGPYHGVRINADGTGSYVDGNLGAVEPTTLTGLTYRAMGWTISTTPTGVRFVNDRTGKGAVVGTDRVRPF
ncbi:hypothetical protein [Mycolicibacterium vaccae]|uniref:hypothetical protein n=1 Tax=Mycolicibacterium vaccae TaxID=1810 RepID=UPI003CFF7B18